MFKQSYVSLIMFTAKKYLKINLLSTLQLEFNCRLSLQQFYGYHCSLKEKYKTILRQV